MTGKDFCHSALSSCLRFLEEHFPIPGLLKSGDLETGDRLKSRQLIFGLIFLITWLRINPEPLNHIVLKRLINIILFFFATPVSHAQNRPNILFIPVDDLRPEAGAYGNPIIRTPNIDRIAKQGVVFLRAYCQQAVCNPSRASLLTGLRPDSLRVWDLQTDFRKNLPAVVTLPQYFRQNSYTTVGIGKTYHNIFPDSASWTRELHVDGYPFDPDAVYASAAQLAIQEEKKKKFIADGNISRIDRYGLWYLKAGATENADVSDDAYYDGAQTTMAIAELGRLAKEGNPFFLSVGYYRPHLPFNAPRKYWDLYDKNKLPLASNPFIPKGSPDFAVHGDRELRSYDDFHDLPLPGQGILPEDRQRELIHGYYASISYIDAQIGRLLDKLDQLGLSKNTIIVLWGDHGWKLGEHNSWAKQSNYEIDTRVPLIVGGAGVKAKGKATKSLTEFVDIYPTLCEMAGLPVPTMLQGTSFAPLLKKPDTPWKQAAFSQFLLGRFPRGSQPEKMGYAIRTDRYRYVEWYTWVDDKPVELLARELFDHTRDPKENINLAAIKGYESIVEQHALGLKAGWRAAQTAQK